jgi:hypothetical protein
MSTSAVKQSVERRMEFIEFRLFWEGKVNRGDIIKAFELSVPQASKDLALYQERAPDNAVYDKKLKRYVAGPHFVPVFLKPDPDEYLSRLRSAAERPAQSEKSWIGSPPDAETVVTPHRNVGAAVLRSILTAVREDRSIEVLYQSMNEKRIAPIWRRITPHAFGFDGFRWHARAYCHLDENFQDFLLPRMLDVGGFAESGVSAANDVEWSTEFRVIIGPHPALAPSQKAVVEKDYGMTDGRAVLIVRRAMLFYVLKRLGLLNDAEKENPRAQHVVAINRKEISVALAEIDGGTRS